MRPASLSMWTLTGARVYLGAVTRAAGVLDIGLVFPRTNGAYSPMGDFPIVFALQNSRLAEHLKPSIWYQILNVTGDIETLVDSTHEFNWTNASQNDPYLLWSHIKVQGEGKLRILWQPRWSSCDESRDEVRVVRNRTHNFLVDFEIKEGGEKADLVAATNNGNGEDCPNEGVGIDVTDKTLEAQGAASSARETCAVLGTSSPTSTSNPCKVKIGKATVESMEAADFEKKCRGLNPPNWLLQEFLASPLLSVLLFCSLDPNGTPTSSTRERAATTTHEQGRPRQRCSAIPVCRNSRLYYPVVSESVTCLCKCESPAGSGNCQITCPGSKFPAPKSICSLRDGDIGRLIKEDIVKGALVLLAHKL